MYRRIRTTLWKHVLVRRTRKKGERGGEGREGKGEERDLGSKETRRALRRIFCRKHEG